MNDLFEIPESLSPRLLWIEKHGIIICYDSCRKQFYAIGANDTGWGDTEDEALTQLALKLGVKLWNEEESK